ncbi:hypothetical protein GCM10020229_57180 [Kitasatospora albolonga]
MRYGHAPSARGGNGGRGVTRGCVSPRSRGSNLTVSGPLPPHLPLAPPRPAPPRRAAPGDKHPPERAAVTDRQTPGSSPDGTPGPRGIDPRSRYHAAPEEDLRRAGPRRRAARQGD